MEQKQRFINLARSDRFTIKEGCEEFGISRKTEELGVNVQILTTSEEKAEI